MLAACRTGGAGLAMPPFALVSSDVAGCLEALWELPSACHDCCVRRAPRAHCFDSMGGQGRTRARQSIEPMALHVDGGCIRGMQRCMRAVRWEEEQMRWHSHPLVADARGDPEGVLRFDATGCVNKGTEAVGVARQYGGTLGQVEHGPVGVCAGDASRQGDSLVDKRLCLPAAGWTAAYAARRTRCNVPAALPWQSQPPWAAAMWQAMAQAGLRPGKSVVADGLSGHSPDCLDTVEAWVGVTALVAMAAETRCGLQRPQTVARC